MPAYNAAATIEDAIHSVRWQTESRWELIVVDDGSTDGTADVAARAAAGDPRIRIIRQPHAGRPTARNRCLRELSGTFIAICDADDVSLPNRFAATLEAFGTDASVGVVASCRVLAIADDPPWKGVITAPCTDEAVHAAFSRRRMPILFASCTLRTSLVTAAGGFDPELLRNQDYGLLVRVHKGVTFRQVSEPMIIYRTLRAVASRRLVFESNFFRHYATRRASGLTLSAREFATTARGRAYRWLAMPLMFGWFVAKRALLRLDTPPATPGEDALIDETLRHLATLRGTEPRSMQAPASRRILGSRVDCLTYNDTTARVVAWAHAGESRYVCIANVHMLMEAVDDEAFRTVLNDADLVTSDGMPLVWGLRALGLTRAVRVYGPILMPRVCEALAAADLPIALLGGAPETLERLSVQLHERFPRLRIAYTHSPPFRDMTEAEESAIVNELSNSGARVIFVGLGCPKQERLMARLRGRTRAPMLGVGAAFDFIAGAKPSAPALVQAAGLEWLFRLLTEPRRLWKRYLKQNPRFVWHFGRQLLREYRR